MLTMKMTMKLLLLLHALVVVTTHDGAKQYLMNMSKQYEQTVDILGVGTYPAVMTASGAHRKMASVTEMR